jgi:F0F1-type ATP synthase epsilon subunit
MELRIISPEQTVVHAVTWVEVETIAGNFVIQPGHAPTILLLAPHKELNFGLINGKQESLLVPRGIIEVSRTTITLIINQPVEE